MGNPDYIQASCVSGAQILVYVQGVISYDAGHNYRRWSLQASPTVFYSHTEKYVYVAVPRDTNSTKNAFVVFPSEEIDIYGNNAAGTQIGSADYYYIFLQGIITSSGDNGTTAREWAKGHSIATGLLSSDEAIAARGDESEWYKYSSVDQTTTFLKNLTMKAGTWFKELFVKNLQIKSGGNLSFENDNVAISGVAKTDKDIASEEKLVTPKYMDDHALSSDHADTAKGEINFLRGIIAEELSKFTQGVQFGDSFASGLTGFGGKIDGKGLGELEALTLRRWLEVPELRFNRVSVIVGNQWRAPGGGIIESVVPDMAEDGTELQKGVAYLKLEDGEIGKIAEDDICMGVWHDNITANNSDEDYDDSRGNFRFSGFFTAYFRIVEVMSVDGGLNNAFRYVLRNDDNFPYPKHPKAMMHFVSYGNFTDTTRQESRYSTLTYERYLQGVNTWEFSERNIGAQFGDLSNLSVFGLQMSGYSAYLNNIYMSGTIKQFDAIPYRMEVSNDLDGFLAWGESCTLTFTVMKGWDDVTDKVTAWKIERNTGDAASDTAWRQKQKVKDFAGCIVVSHNEAENDLGSELSTLFVVTATIGSQTTMATVEI